MHLALAASVVLGLRSPGQVFIDQCASKLKEVSSVSYIDHTSYAGRSSDAAVKLLRGGYWRFTSHELDQIATPDAGWMITPSDKQYRRWTTKELQDQKNHPESGFEEICGTTHAQALGNPESSKLGNAKTIRVCFARPGAAVTVKQYLHFDPATKLPVGRESIDPDGFRVVSVYQHLQLNAGLTAKDFQWTPPADWRETFQKDGG